MNAISGILTAIFLLAGTGYAMDKLYVEVRRAALTKASQGLPSLSAYTRRLTCKEISRSGELVAYRKGRCRK